MCGVGGAVYLGRYMGNDYYLVCQEDVAGGTEAVVVGGGREERGVTYSFANSVLIAVCVESIASERAWQALKPIDESDYRINTP